MKHHRSRELLVGIAVAAASLTGSFLPPLHGQTTAAVEQRVATARAAAGDQHIALFNTICPRSSAEVAAQAAAMPVPRPAPLPGQPEWYVEPVKVFDNLYFVGQSDYSAWAVATPEGIIVIDALFDYSVEAEIADGLAKLGLDPATIRYVVVSHGHSDHAGGARYLQERFGARVVMSEADWNLVENTGGDWPKPVRDIVAGDGYEITLGGTTVTLYLTPGHTAGTISSVIPVTDDGTPHVAVAWGGTAFNFRGSAEFPREFWLESYSGSAERFREIASRAGADVLIANHPRFDGSPTKLPALARRQPGDPHPYVIGGESVAGYLTVATECAKAQLDAS
jgi:metallo-beta-lactamase class B